LGGGSKYNKGYFLVIEGIDGSGKTTQCIKLIKQLRSKHIHAIYTSEPSQLSIGRFIRRNILAYQKHLPEVEALLFAADRYYHLKKIIIPALEQNAIVICDRYLYASLAYQGAQGVTQNWIRELNRFALNPDLAIYLDVQPEVALNRKKGKKDVLENINLGKKVRSIYLDLVKSGELLSLDGNGTTKEVEKRLYSLVKQYLPGLL
jgi:dTMP kinase